MTALSLILITSIGILMLYTGMLVGWQEFILWIRQGNGHILFKLGLVNYLLIPLITYALYHLLSMPEALALALLTLSVIPCAPLVPSLMALTRESAELGITSFFIFSALNMVMLIIITLILSPEDTATAIKMFKGLGHYLLGIYIPMVIGFVLRLYFPVVILRCLPSFKRLASLSVLVAVVAFSTGHINEIKAISIDELWLIVAVQLITLILIVPLSRFMKLPLLGTLLISGFRNIALVIPFAVIVFKRPDISAYIIVYAVIALCLSLITVAAFSLVREKKNVQEV